jgi:hypothetical protein
MLNYDYEREKRDDKNSLVFQPLVQGTFSSTDSDEEETKTPNRCKFFV